MVINVVSSPWLRDLQEANKTFPGMLMKKGSAFELKKTVEKKAIISVVDATVLTA